MNKKLIRLTESDLHRIVKESVNRVIKEAKIDTPYQTQRNKVILMVEDNKEWATDHCQIQ